MSKRQRTSTSSNVTRRAKRPIDKALVNLETTNVVAAQQAVVLYAAATFPGTITGLRWSIVGVRSGGTANTLGRFKWAIAVIPAGTVASTISMASAATMYSPEQNVLAFGVGATWNSNVGNGDDMIMFEGSTKAMRKLRAGDALHFLVFGTATERHDVTGTVQFFYKT